MLRIKFISLLVLMIVGDFLFAQKTIFEREFAPKDNFVKPQERPFRDAVCLNGQWQFLPVQDAALFSKENLRQPALPVNPVWEATPVKVPSPWNVNSFAKGNGGDFITYPSYPKKWEDIRAGWLMKKFLVNSSWKNKRLILRFGAVSGFTQVYVNKKKVAENFDIFLPFEIDITDEVDNNVENELLVWVADAKLFNEPGKYGDRTFVAGSFWGRHIVGIWQDVYLIAKPELQIDNIFIKPYVNRDELEIEAAVVNHTSKERSVSLQASVMPWLNITGKSILEYPEVKWSLGKTALDLNSDKISVAPNSRQIIRVSVKVNDKLRLWTSENPNLYGVIVSLMDRKKVVDKHYQRFGWRQFSIVKDKFYLNRKQIVLKGDSWHFMGIPQMTRRYAYAWYKMLKDCNGNAVRLHAQPFPEFYLDMADEMGIFVLDETGMWASDGGPKADSEEYWKHSENHLRRMLLRDRNHPSVFGWSVCNENLPVVINVQHAPEDIIKRQVSEINKWIRICREMDPSREWISGDGETNLPTDLPVVIGHYGFENEIKNWSSQGKIWGIGEQGMAYSGTPKEASKFIGEAAYESMYGRMQGVANEAVQLLNLQKKYNASFSSVFNVVWYGLKPLELGLKDTTKAPRSPDGVFFTNYKEQTPGVQPERLGAYTTTLNPGYDPSLPLYKTWPLFDVVKKSFANNLMLPEFKVSENDPSGITKNIAGFNTVMLLSVDKDSSLKMVLQDLGIEVKDVPNKNDKVLLILDGKFPPNDQQSILLASSVLKNSGSVFIWGIQPSSVTTVNKYLPYAVKSTSRESSSFLPKMNHPLLNGLNNSDFYFTEIVEQMPMKYGIAGDVVKHSNVLLEACNTDWKTWNHRPEYIKTSAVLRSERESKAEGKALIEMNKDNGKIYLFALEPEILYRSAITLLRKMFVNMGISFTGISQRDKPAISSKGVLENALVAGVFSGKDKSVLEMSKMNPLAGLNKNAFALGKQVQNHFWEMAGAQDGVFDFKKMGLPGASDDAFVYLSFWMFSPRSLSDLLVAPDMPRLDMYIGADDAFQVFLNDQLIKSALKEGGIKKREQVIQAVPLQKGWNHFLIKVIQKRGDWKLAVEFDSDKKEFLQELKSQLSAVF